MKAFIKIKMAEKSIGMRISRAGTPVITHV
jgi:hypothetical protein